MVVVQRGCVNCLPGQREVPVPPQGVVQEEIKQERRGGGATAGPSEEEAGHGGRPGKRHHGTLCQNTGYKASCPCSVLWQVPVG